MVDALLRPFLIKVPSYIESYQDFRRKISQYRKIRAGTLLCTFDIKDLYTNIDHTLAIKAIMYWMRRHHDLTHQAVCKLLRDSGERSTLFIADNHYLVTIITNAVRLILDNNIFMFDGDYYQQVKGIAMGSSAAPIIANLTIAYLEIRLYKKVRKVLGEQIGSYVKKHWYRYIDDCQLVWPFAIKTLDRFTDILQTLDKAIVLVREVSSVNLPFLNIMLEIKMNKLEFDIYYKPTQTFAYLHFHSSHPRHIKRRVPYTLATMINTIVSNEIVRQKRLLEMQQQLRTRKYPSRLIKDAIESRAGHKCISEQRFLNFRIVYNRNNPDLYSFVFRQLPSALGERRAKKFVSRKVSVLSLNLKRLLTTSRFHYMSNPPSKLPSQCHREQCSMCKSIVLPSNDLKKYSNGPIDCTSRFFVYRLDCKSCNQSSFEQTHCLKSIKRCNLCKGKRFDLCPFHKMNTDRVVPRQLCLDYFLRKRK